MFRLIIFLLLQIYILASAPFSRCEPISRITKHDWAKSTSKYSRWVVKEGDVLHLKIGNDQKEVFDIIESPYVSFIGYIESIGCYALSIVNDAGGWIKLIHRISGDEHISCDYVISPDKKRIVSYCGYDLVGDKNYGIEILLIDKKGFVKEFNMIYNPNIHNYHGHYLDWWPERITWLSKDSIEVTRNEGSPEKPKYLNPWIFLIENKQWHVYEKTKIKKKLLLKVVPNETIKKMMLLDGM